MPCLVTVVGEGQTISSISFQVHSSSQNTFGANSSLQRELMLRRCALNEFGLVHKTSMSSLRRAGEPSCNFPLRTEKLRNRYSKDWQQQRMELGTHMDIASRHLSKSAQAACYTE